MVKSFVKKTVLVLLMVFMAFSTFASGSSESKKDSFTVGICQLVQHSALDAATQGFKDALTEKMGDKVKFNEQNASGDSATCITICNNFVSANVDLILANATPALQAAQAATGDIPILGTAVTDFGTALDISNMGSATGINVSGTSDLAPLNEQANMIVELFPKAKKVGILFCSAEANSVFQVKKVKSLLEAKGIKVVEFAFTDSNDVSSVTANACQNVDVLYVPTDNTAASCTEAIRNIVEPAKVPVVAGEEGVCAGCGVATLTISYYDLGWATGEMAVKVLSGEDVSKMPIEYSPKFTKKYNAELCKVMGVKVPSDYQAI